jgi:phosphate transport system substrate-binding protein
MPEEMQMRFLLFCLSILMLPGFSVLHAADASGAKSYTWVGCGITKKAFMSSLAKAYAEETGITIDIKGGGATKGIREVSRLNADMGGACRYALENHPLEDQVKMVPMAWDALVVITHRDNPVDSITLEQLEAVYRGQIDNWSALGGNNVPIRLFVRDGKISGVGRTLRELVFRDTGFEFEAADTSFPSSGPLEQAVETEAAAIAVTGISSARKRDVKILRLNGLEPSYDNIKNGNYLLYRPLYLVLNAASENYQELLDFADFANSPRGREVVRANGVVPYLEAPALLLKQMEQWSTASNK